MTKSYANYFFNKDINFPEWIRAANRFDLYLFIENQDLEIKKGNLLSPENTIKLEESIRQEFDFQQVFYYSIKCPSDDLFYRAIEIIDREFTFS
ncbi:MAG: hypothetical protein P1P88_22945, partial [Bacteroidales bacterium]|nr:hypothetical protein [Bacteroidales bacterium]